MKGAAEGVGVKRGEIAGENILGGHLGRRGGR